MALVKTFYVCQECGPHTKISKLRKKFAASLNLAQTFSGYLCTQCQIFINGVKGHK
eukprot:UN20133